MADQIGGGTRVQAMLARGLIPGIGNSTSLGWFRVVCLAEDASRAESAEFVISCGPEEMQYLHSLPLRFVQCRAEKNHGDTLRVAVLVR